MVVNVNGRDAEVAIGCSVADLIALYKLQPQFVAVEVNHELVPRRQFAATPLNEGDQVEIVTLVGGG